MRRLSYAVVTTALIFTALACDGSETPASAGTGSSTVSGSGGSGVGLSDQANDQGAPISTEQQAPAPTEQQAPAPTEQQAPASIDQAAPSPGGTTSGGGVESATGCSALCTRIAALDCEDYQPDCAELCAVMDTGSCQSTAARLLACARTISSCDDLDDCEAAYSSWIDCEDEASIPTSTAPSVPTTSPNLTISNSACNTATSCAKCSSTCDLCLCTGQRASASSNEIKSACGSYCTSS
jgi:hypothetical protein